MDRAAAPALALLAACFSPEPPAGAPCAAEQRCPSPLACIAGTCQMPGTPGDGPAGDGPAGDGPASDGPTTPDGAPLQCPAAFTRTASGACHLDVASPAPWLDAELDCEQRGGHLVVPGSAAEAMELRNPRWIGVTDRITEGTFRAVTGATISFSYWGIGEPGGLPDCAHTGFQARWHAGPSDFQFPYVCEYDGLPAVPGAYQ